MSRKYEFYPMLLFIKFILDDCGTKKNLPVQKYKDVYEEKEKLLFIVLVLSTRKKIPQNSSSSVSSSS